MVAPGPYGYRTPTKGVVGTVGRTRPFRAAVRRARSAPQPTFLAGGLVDSENPPPMWPRRYGHPPLGSSSLCLQFQGEGEGLPVQRAWGSIHEQLHFVK